MVKNIIALVLFVSIGMFLDAVMGFDSEAFFAFYGFAFATIYHQFD